MLYENIQKLNILSKYMSDKKDDIPWNELVNSKDDVISNDNTGGNVEYDNIHVMMLLSKYEAIVCNLYLVYELQT